MTYEKPEVEVLKFENTGFMTAGSNENYATSYDALYAACTGFKPQKVGKTNRFTCDSFGGYGGSNPPKQGDTVYLGGGKYVFDYVGNHWKES